MSGTHSWFSVRVNHKNTQTKVPHKRSKSKCKSSMKHITAPPETNDYFILLKYHKNWSPWGNKRQLLDY